MGGLRLSAGQKAHFDATNQDALARELLALIRTSWLDEFQRWRPGEAHAFVRQAIAVAANDGFLKLRDFAHYVNIAVAIRADIEADADTHAIEWIVSNRGDRRLCPSARIDRMYVQLYRRYEALPYRKG